MYRVKYFDHPSKLIIKKQLKLRLIFLTFNKEEHRKKSFLKYYTK
jgi:hypothetical protein